MSGPGKMDAYAKAGVDISLANRAKELIGRQVSSTHGPEVLGGFGFFGGLYEFRGYQQPVLVSSTDSVGTKLKLANALKKHDTIGIDIVNHCVNDIFTCGARPLFFLDYIGIGKMVPEKVESIVVGLTQACREVGCALIGGETAELPGLYAGGDYDLVGFIVGVVEKDGIIMGERIAAGDTLIGLPSSGLHTNGYSLARRIFGETAEELSTVYPELGRPVGEVLLEPHRCYYHQLKSLLPQVRGIAHITGGGLVGNVPRMLPTGLAARFDSRAWTVPPIFKLIQGKGNVSRDEMYRVFNMGVGMVVACAPADADGLMKNLPESRLIGQVVKQTGEERVIIK